MFGRVGKVLGSLLRLIRVATDGIWLLLLPLAINVEEAAAAAATEAGMMVTEDEPVLLEEGCGGEAMIG